ncbi:RidA family protein [Robiginitalea sp. IMCC43444]|uniref:RidA family protein n=1 Tax=Robiginitalea sp. IMCC43444 TaxID=3459121 RepID=UPI004041A292
MNLNQAEHQSYALIATCLLVVCLCFGCGDTQSGHSGDGAVLQVGHINTHDGYSEAVTTEYNGVKTVYISGQVGDGDTFEAQMRSALSNLEASLEAAGATMNDVVKMNTYIVAYTPETLEVFRRVRKELMGELKMPASTLVGVEALALPDWMIEIEAIAVVQQ